MMLGAATQRFCGCFTSYHQIKPPITKPQPKQHLLNKCFKAEYLDSIHEGTGEPMRAVWEKAWGEHYDDWSTFSCPEACCNQVRGLEVLGWFVGCLALTFMRITQTHSS